MNMQAMIQQAQKLQKEVENTKKELESTIYRIEKEFLEIEANGKKQITKLKIKEKVEIDEIFEDIILVTINELFEKIDKEKQQKMNKYGSGLNGLI